MVLTLDKNSENKRFNSKKLIVLIAVAGLLVSTALAWFVYTVTPFDDLFGLSNFSTQLDCYFYSGSTRTEKTNYVDQTTGLINLSLDSTQTNYIGNFRVDVKYMGKGHGYLRVKVVTQAKDPDGYVTTTDSKIPYTLYSTYSDNQHNDQAAWFDNRNVDFCYYYATALSGNDSTFTTIQLITGAQTTDYTTGFDVEYLRDNGYTIRVAVESDMVQINRYPQFWGINTLPWK